MKEVNRTSFILSFVATRVAFYAYMSVDRGIDWFSLDKKIIYDKVNLNIGDGYDVLTGVFTAPSSGTYIFNTGES